MVGLLQQLDSTAAAHPDKEEVSRQLVWQQAARSVFARQRASTNIYDSSKFVDNLIHRKF
jgi:hypothetical protein